MSRIIMHIDVNNAFLSWSAVLLLREGYDIDIRKVEAIIGGDESKRHGIVLAKSMRAKRRGVKTAMTIREAKRLCPYLRIYPPNYHWYKQMSNSLFNIIRKYTPDIEILSIDECFIDYTPIEKLYGNPLPFAYNLKNEIKDKLGFTVNIGIANNKLCAKMASDFTKPDRVHTLYLDEVEKKMYPLDVSDLYGVGKSSSKKLKELGINTISDLAHSSIEHLYKYFKNRASIMIEHARGIDNEPLITDREEAKGISNSTTLPYNYTIINELLSVLRNLVENVALKLREQNKYTYVVGVTLKDKYFKSYSHQKKLDNATNQTDVIYNAASSLLKEMWDEEPIRLIGISLTKLSDKSYHQVSLFENVVSEESNTKLDKALDLLKKQYGNKVIYKASLKNSNVKKKY